MYRYYQDSFLALHEDVTAFAWSAPMRDLAAMVAMSDVGLKKLLKSLGVVTPPQGYWNKVHAGKAVPAKPRPRERRPGETGRVMLDGRLRGHVQAVDRMPVDGPFASRYVPEDLGELRAQELAAIGKAAAPRDLSRPHPGLSALLKKEQSRREKCAASRWHWDEPKFDAPLAKRKLRIFSGILFTLAKRGHSGSVYERDEQARMQCEIGDTRLELRFEVIGHHKTERRGGYQLPARDLPANTRLRLLVGQQVGGAPASTWQDEENERIEDRLAEICADLVVAGEAAFRNGLRDALERERQYREWQEKREREESEKRDQERLAFLEESGALLRKADEIRALVARLGDGRELASQGVDEKMLQSWKEWALARADTLDPVKSGKVLTHVLDVISER